MTKNTSTVMVRRDHRIRTSVDKTLDIRECELPFEGLYCEHA